MRKMRKIKEKMIKCAKLIRKCNVFENKKWEFI